jgi:ceramide glucosyltransferase
MGSQCGSPYGSAEARGSDGQRPAPDAFASGDQTGRRAVISLLLGLATFGVVASLCYYAAAAVAAVRFRARSAAPTPPLPKPPPRVAVLKPLLGLTRSLADNLTSYLESDYPRIDFLFAVSNYEDSATEAAVAARSRYPYANVTLVVGEEPCVSNRKIAKVIRMVERAPRAQAFVLSDADISVEREHLSRLIAELFADEQTGMVTCIYRARPSGSFAARLAALFVNTDFAPMVLVSEMIEPISYALGATIAVRREALEAAGGMRVVGDKLADDFELGRAVVERGWKIKLSHSIVTSASEERDFAEFWRRKLRWARTYRIVRPVSLLTIFVNGPLWALVMLALTRGSIPGIAIFSAVIAARLAMAAAMICGVLKIPELLRDLWLVPIKDLVMASIWATSLVGSKVVWGGRCFKVAHNGVMREVVDG